MKVLWMMRRFCGDEDTSHLHAPGCSGVMKVLWMIQRFCLNVVGLLGCGGGFVIIWKFCGSVMEV